MFILRIEHPVPSFEGWKNAFDSDPVGREKSGVRRYRISRTIDDANYVTVDLEFDSAREAEALLTALRVVWGRVQGKVMTNPVTRTLEVVESKEY
jgi:ribosomal protein L35AE/L33A